MIKKIFVSLIIFFLSINGFCNLIINWKGYELGLNPRPIWLTNLIKKNDEKLIRKKFDIGTDNSIFWGEGKSENIEEAKIVAQQDCYSKIKKWFRKSSLSGIEFVYEYWEELDDNTYTVISIYQVQKY